MLSGDDGAAPGATASVVRLVIVVIMVFAAVLGVTLALEYPKYEPDCGPQAGGGAQFARCQGVTSLAVPLSVESSM